MQRLLEKYVQDIKVCRLFVMKRSIIRLHRFIPKLLLQELYITTVFNVQLALDYNN